jgi:hypothetical protein
MSLGLVPDGPPDLACEVCGAFHADLWPLVEDAFRAAGKAPPRLGDPASNGSGPAARLPALRFFTPGELRALAPEGADWIVEGLLAAGCSTLLSGPPKVGKSTLLVEVLRALVTDRERLLGRAVAPCPVVLLSEEGAASLADKLTGAGIGDDDPLHCVPREGAIPLPAWPEAIAAAHERAGEVDARVLAIDTAAKWIRFGPERAKDSGAVQAALEGLVAVMAEGIAVLIVHHHRKGGGEDGEAIRDSGALLGWVDVSLELVRPPGEEREDAGSRRIIRGLSRWPATPEELAVERQGDGRWIVVGPAERLTPAQRDLLALIPEPSPGRLGATVADLAAETDTTPQNVRKLAAVLVGAGLAEREGTGSRLDPHRYTRKGAE